MNTYLNDREELKKWAVEKARRCMTIGACKTCDEGYCSKRRYSLIPLERSSKIKTSYGTLNQLQLSNVEICGGCRDDGSRCPSLKNCKCCFTLEEFSHEDTPYTVDQVATLLESYNSSTNGFDHLSFKDWVREAELVGVIDDLLEG